MSIIAGRTMMSSDYTALGVHFDGTNDWLSKASDLSGNANGKTGLLSIWIYLDRTGRHYIINDNGDDVRVEVPTATNIRIIAENASSVDILTMESTGALTTDVWHHVLASWDLANTSGWLYIDDVDVLAASPTLTNDTINYTAASWAIGAKETTSGLKFEGNMAQVYFNVAASLDLSVTANRRKFITADIQPVFLGFDGSIPTGTAPIIFLDGVFSLWPTNKGTGGGFTENGTLTVAASNP